MPKKKKNKKITKAKNRKIAKKTSRGKSAIIKKKAVALKEKVLGEVSHFFGHISVAAVKMKNTLRTGDYIHIKGHTTDFVQKIDSMQIEHETVGKAAKGDDIGIKVKAKARVGDMVYLADPSKISVAPTIISKPAAKVSAGQLKIFAPQNVKPAVFQPEKVIKPMQNPEVKPPKPAAGNPDSYAKTKFINF